MTWNPRLSYAPRHLKSPEWQQMEEYERTKQEEYRWREEMTCWCRHPGLSHDLDEVGECHWCSCAGFSPQIVVEDDPPKWEFNWEPITIPWWVIVGYSALIFALGLLIAQVVS